ncbi:MAG: hypothetical protein ACLPSF_14705 [Methylocella sp.]
MPYLMACILVVGAALGLFASVKIILLMAGVCLLLGLASSVLFPSQYAVSWIFAAIVLQCGYFTGLLIQTWLRANGQALSKFANRLRGAQPERPPPSKDGAA